MLVDLSHHIEITTLHPHYTKLTVDLYSITLAIQDISRGLKAFEFNMYIVH